MATDIIVVSYKDEEPLKKCLDSIKEHCTDYNLIIEDNNPPRPNLGFTKSVNAGIEKGTAEFIWLVNSDAIVLEGAQQALINRFSFGPEVGIVGSQQLDYEDRDRIRCGGVYPNPFPGGVHRAGRVSMGNWRFPEKQTWYTFSSVMLRRKMVSEVGLLDSRMFLICSDSDYCFRCRQAEFTVWYEPQSKILHGLKASQMGSEWHKKDIEIFMEKWGIKILPDKNYSTSKEFDRLCRFP